MDMTILPPQEAMGMPARTERLRTASRLPHSMARMRTPLAPLHTRYRTSLAPHTNLCMPCCCLPHNDKIPLPT